ncbi:hypothetical protein SAY87_003762 [Trapa incisa]|uniref:Uncharacterized protein n=1 Tax=Trapa incisa TaxID=236973 RepID=A0AAN7KS20_9MYRT|nr:hypothetical protein SAY87_003762 [Trapa incisa]
MSNPPDASAPFPPPPLTVTFTVTLVIFFILSILSICFFRCFSDNNIRDGHRNPNRPAAKRNNGLDPVVIQAFPTCLLRRQAPPQGNLRAGMRHMPVGFRRRQCPPPPHSLLPCLPSRVHRYLARVPQILPRVPWKPRPIAGEDTGEVSCGPPVRPLYLEDRTRSRPKKRQRETFGRHTPTM